MLAQAACTFSDESARPARARGLLHQAAPPTSYQVEVRARATSPDGCIITVQLEFNDPAFQLFSIRVWADQLNLLQFWSCSFNFGHALA